MSESKKPNWVLRIVLGVAAVGGFVLVIGGVIAYRYFTEPDRRAAMDAMLAAAQRPGTREIRAEGCDLASVQSAAELTESIRLLVGKADFDQTLPSDLLVHCQLEPGTAREPTCEAVAQAFARGAADHPAEFYVQVMRQSFKRGPPICEGIYDGEGRRLRAASFAVPGRE